MDISNYWIINDKVYNLEPFLQKHPGGSYILELNRGRDCTELFYSYHIMSSKNVVKMLKKYYVGDLNDIDKLNDESNYLSNPHGHNDHNGFEWTNPIIFNDFKSRLHKHFKNKSHKATLAAKIKYFILFIFSILTYYGWFSGYWISLPFVALVGWYFSGDILHSSTHYSISSSRVINELLSYFGIYHCLPLLWYHQHVIGHHAHTNIQDKDPDLDHFKGTQYTSVGWRTHIGQKYEIYYQYWRRFTALTMALTSYDPIFFKAYNVIKSGTYMDIVPFKFISDLAFFSFIFQLGLLLSIPISLVIKFGLIKGLLFFIIPRVLHGTIYYIFSQISHISGEAFNSNKYNDEWIVHQIQSTIDYSTDSYLWNHLSGGLNNQAVHHICPTVHPCHYPEVNKILVQLCKDHNIKYVRYDTFYEALMKHFEYLGEINDNSDNNDKENE